MISFPDLVTAVALIAAGKILYGLCVSGKPDAVVTPSVAVEPVAAAPKSGEINEYDERCVEIIMEGFYQSHSTFPATVVKDIPVVVAAKPVKRIHKKKKKS